MSKMKRNITDLNIQQKKKGTATDDKRVGEPKLEVKVESNLAESDKILSTVEPNGKISEVSRQEADSDLEIVAATEPVSNIERDAILKMSFSTEMLCKSENLVVEEIEVSSY